MQRSYDTLKISFIGFKSIDYVTPFRDRGKYLVKFKLYIDSVSLEGIEIFPFPTYEEFKKAFLVMNKQDEQIKMEGVNLYSDRNVDLFEFKIIHLLIHPLSFIYDKLLDKKARLNRKLDRRRSTIEKSAYY